jgi:hypothetical protein
VTLIDALWIGPYGYRKGPEGTLLETGITVCQVGMHEAVASENWQPVGDVVLPDAPEPEPEQEQAPADPPPVDPTPDGGDS